MSAARKSPEARELARERDAARYGRVMNRRAARARKQFERAGS